ncbi:MAG TPA: hypothetical protein PK867_31195, partial [Pirellulales bacterium]|nr:hypothetical protein [Pirellulales bacterium]
MSLVCQPETRRAALGRPNRSADARPSAIVVGGGANALSIARSLGRRGIPVYAVNEPEAHVCHSRHARWLAEAGASPQSWEQWLTGPQSDAWRGSVLLAASDAAIKLILDHRPVLAEKFILDICNPRAQAAMLNKLGTYQAAVAAGVPTPRFWTAKTLAELENIR